MSEKTELKPGHGKRARAKAANRQAILDAARIVFARLGYEATNIRDIIRETNLASGTFYNYFKSKEEVFETIAIDAVHRFRPLLKAAKDSAETLESYLLTAYTAYFRFLTDENMDAIAEGTPHMALIGVRVDTPDMQAISDEIREDLGKILAAENYPALDVDYLAAAAIGIAREMGDHMLKRRPIDPVSAGHFATQLVLGGIGTLVTEAPADDAKGEAR